MDCILYNVYYFVYGLSDFMQLVDSAFTVHICSAQDLLLEHCVLYFLFCVWTLGFYAAS